MYVTPKQKKVPLLANFPYSWHISRNDGKFHTKTDYAKGTKQEKDSNKQIGAFISNTKIQNKDLATLRIRRKKNDYIAIFTKKQTSDKVYRFSDK